MFTEHIHPKAITTNAKSILHVRHDSGLDSFLALLLRPDDALDDTDGNGLPHVTDGETTKRREVSERLNTQWLGRLQVDDTGISCLDELGVFFQDLTRTTVHLLLDVSEFARNMGGVTIEHGRVSVGNLSRVVHHNDLSLERRHTRGGIVLGIRGDVSTTEILDGNVLDVEANVVSRDGLRKRLVVHFDRLDFSNNTSGGEHCVDTGLDDTSLNTADRDSSDTTNLVHILERKTEGLISGALGRGDQVKCLEQVGSLVPGHVGGFLNHVITLPSRYRDKRDLHRLVADLLEKVEEFALDFIVAFLGELDGLIVHLVAGDDHLLDTKGVSEKSVLTSLSILGDTSLETTLRRVNDQNGDVSLRCSRNHVLDEVTVSRGINDGELVLGRLELPQSDIDGDTALTLRLEVIEHPRVLKRSLSKLRGFLLVLLDRTLIDTSTLINQVSGSGRLS